MATFVIVHGAWGGAWSWNKFVVPALREAGQTVHAVTLTGLGERTHLASPEISLDTHIEDVVNVLFYEDLTDVILVGHSYGGNVITGVADRVPERLQQLVYLDAATPGDGQSSADTPPGRRRELEVQARQSGDGWKVPPGPVPTDQPAEVTAWATPRRSPMPIRTMTTALKLSHGETTLPRAFVYCTLGKEPGSPQAARAERIRSDPRWRFFELHTGHNLHYTAPNETVGILLELARSPVAAAR
ncbi:MAG TPA: alpha/beta fold hydrolase [Chloroflexota bacterium]|nr:alpha/beta fold hydrolase [Chloroflexota bacterium]